MIRSKSRGNNTIFKDGKWYYEETGLLVSETHNIMSCGYCGRNYTEEGHDGCLGNLIGLMNACCGHGIADEAYIQFWDGECISGKDAVNIIEILKKYSTDNSKEKIQERKEFLALASKNK